MVSDQSKERLMKREFVRMEKSWQVAAKPAEPIERELAHDPVAPTALPVHELPGTQVGLQIGPVKEGWQLVGATAWCSKAALEPLV